MSSLNERLQELARLLLECADLARVATYFHDEVAVADCLDHSESVESPEIRQIVELSMQTVLGQGTRFDEMRCFVVNEAGFVHGAGLAQDHIIAFFIFTRLGKGMAVISHQSQTGPSHFMRLTMSILPPSAFPVRNPGGTH